MDSPEEDNSGLSIPKVERSFPYPKCWQDEKRMQVLLAPFRERTVNPENYDSKMKFWKDIIAEYCFFKGSACFCKQELQQQFTRDQRVPSCLDTVLLEMQNLKIIRLRTDYEYDPANSWAGWAVNSLLRRPLSWGQSKIKSFLGASDLSQMGLVEFVHLTVTDNYCNKLQALFGQRPYIGGLHHYETLKNTVCAELNVTDDCFRLCLLTLYSQHKVGLGWKEDGRNSLIHMVKIPSSTNNDITISEADTAMYNLTTTRESLLRQLADLELLIKDNEEKVRLYIGGNKRMLAKIYLRKKLLLEKNYEKRSSALHNIETILSNVDEAQHNGIVVEAYKYGSKALQNALNASNLSYDNVDEVVANVRQSLDTYKDLQDTLSNISLEQNSFQGDEDVLEKELKELMGETSDLMPQAEDSDQGQIHPQKVEITDAELLAMLQGLEVEQKTPDKVAASRAVGSEL